MFGNHWSRHLACVLCTAGVACGSSDTPVGDGGGGDASGAGVDVGASSSGSSGTSGSNSSGASTGSGGGSGGGGDSAIGGGSGSGSGSGASSGSGGSSGTGGGSGGSGDAGATDSGFGAGDGNGVADAGDASQTGPGQYTCTMNATTPYSLGAEHRGLVIFATVIDTTAGANRARAGAIQNVLDTNDMVKFVWPQILTAGHTYEIAMFADFAKNRMCAGLASSMESQFLLPVPAVTGDFEFKWIKPVPRIASCQDFPSPVP